MKLQDQCTKSRAFLYNNNSKLGHVINIISFMIMIYKGPRVWEVGGVIYLNFVESFKTTKYYLKDKQYV